MKVFLIVVLFMITGCSDEQGLKGAIYEFEDNCKGKLTAEFSYSSYSKGIILKCHDFKINRSSN